jgi:hypothetical protein
MSELPPYTGSTSETPPAPTKPAAPEHAVAPVVPGPPLVRPAVWHSRALLIGVAAAALIAAILTGVGSTGFPYNAPVEQIYSLLMMVDLVAVVIAIGALLVVEFVRRANADRRAAPLNVRPSVFAIVAVVLSGIALLAFLSGGGAEQVVDLIRGIRGRYMYWTGALVFAGIPWALGGIFGAWGLRPRGNVATNVLAAVAVAVWLLLAALTTAASLIYGAGLSD